MSCVLRLVSIYMRSLPFTFAARYLVSKKSTNAINLITFISMLGMAVISMAMVLVLSVFNGFEGLTISLFNSFNPDIQVSATEGKVFTVTDEQENALLAMPGIAMVSRVLEEKAALKYDKYEFIGSVKGVDDLYGNVTGIDSAMLEGRKFVLRSKGRNYAVVGAGVQGKLAINPDDQHREISILVPNRSGRKGGLVPTQAFNRGQVLPSGAFSIQAEFDNKYVFVPLSLMQELLQYDQEISALEIKIDLTQTTVAKAKKDLVAIMGTGFTLKDRYEQNAFLYKIMRTEKWITYAILSLILGIAAFNIIGSLSMLVLEKKQDIAVLKALGADAGTIRRIFLAEGLLSSLMASAIGIVIAIIICLIQINFEVIPMPGSGTFVVTAMPVKLKIMDFLLVGGTVVAISLLASWIPAYRAASIGNLVNKE